ncbi:MAG: multiheme c-type cytochrome, partial [Thermoanaerobaculia bacterium]
MSRATLLALCSIILLAAPSMANVCVDCHTEVTPNIVDDWNLSKHSEADVTCDACHGEGHSGAEDVDKVSLPTLNTCNDCHSDQVTQFSAGKHALAWAAMEAMPTTHALPMALTQGMKGCGG